MTKRITYPQDTQTTDCTKSSTEFRNLRSKGIEETLRDLQR